MVHTFHSSIWEFRDSLGYRLNKSVKCEQNGGVWLARKSLLASGISSGARLVKRAQDTPAAWEEGETASEEPGSGPLRGEGGELGSRQGVSRPPGDELLGIRAPLCPAPPPGRPRPLANGRRAARSGKQNSVVLPSQARGPAAPGPRPGVSARFPRGPQEPSRWPVCSCRATEHPEDAEWQRGRPPASPTAPRAPPACTRSASSWASR